MIQTRIEIQGIPAILWGKPSDRVFLHVHGKMSRKEYAQSFAVLAEAADYQTLSFDLPEHGERAGSQELCDVWNGKRDLTVMADYAFAGWKEVSLFACSLGAYFSLEALADRHFARCLFQSPIVDMKWLVQHMMLWANVTEADLAKKQEISTEIDTLRWDYYNYILSHPVTKWDSRTFILYGGRDNLQPQESVEAFAAQFGAALRISPNSSHPFMEAGDAEIVNQWIQDSLFSVQTERLIIHPASDAQMRDLIAAETDEELKAAYSQMLAGCLASPEQRQWYAAWFIDTLSGERVGDLCFKGITHGGSTEIGYGLLPEYWGRGYATEAVTAMARWAAAQPGICAVEAEAEETNLASQRVLQKAGFVPNGIRGEEGPRYVLVIQP